ncbi:hypothetical protein BD626DRAFT_439673 [Schizophyllum amplum]|uniref:Uncharacterized protein n=1 Tax=Schizophyllum amplum TaxID=97359 RepID=A0A550BXN8_9AGAR|nr:hypothetical protein BD626DRAFT_439673 [Auriculariopsis ampla]
MANLSSSTSRRHRLVQGLVSGLFSRSSTSASEQPRSPSYEARPSTPPQTASIASPVPSSTLVGSPELPSSLPSASPYHSHNPATSTSWVVLPVLTSPTSSSDPSFALPAPLSVDSASSSTASLVPSVQPASSSIAALWHEAIARYKSKTGVDLCAEQGVPFDSESSIFQYLDEHQRNFKAFREGGLQSLRRSLTPVVAVLGPLCTIAGEAVGLAFQPSKAIFAAVGELCKGAVEAGDELDAISDAFDTMAHHLRILKPAAAHVLEDDTLREASVKLLAQILVVLGVIRKVWKQGRLVLWLKKLAKSKAVASALADLSRLASTHHETVSAVTLYTAKETMALLTESNAWSQEEQEVTRSSLASITKIAQDVYVMVREYAGLASDEQRANRGILEHIQRALLRQINDMSIVKKTAEIDKIFAWLHCPDSSVKMNSLLDDRAMSTGSWFLDGEEFTSFKKGAITVLWLHGKAGCGKSTMIAAAIRDLQGRPQPPATHRRSPCPISSTRPGQALEICARFSRRYFASSHTTYPNAHVD